MKITAYQIIVEDNHFSLETTVLQMIDEGWQPIGGVTSLQEIYGEQICQAMVKYEENKKKNMEYIKPNYQGYIYENKSRE